MRAITRFLILAFVAAALAMCQSSGDDPSTSSGQADDDDDDIWQPAPGTSWQWQLSGAIDTSFAVAMYDIDLFDNDETTIQALRADGRVVICYFSAGSYEDWRKDAADFPQSALGAPLDDWEGEWWLDIADETVRQLMAARLDLAAAKGCDGVEPDNMDGYANDNGLGLSADDQLDYNRFIADQAHARGLSVGLKNDVDQLDELVESYDWALNEECHVYDECALYDAFTEAGKAVFNAEYVDDWSDAPALAEEICGAYPALDTIVKEWDLTALRIGCE